jgi:hypothetical protein
VSSVTDTKYPSRPRDPALLDRESRLSVVEVISLQANIYVSFKTDALLGIINER